MSNKLNAVDLFSGCGGFSYGFQEAGINVLIGVDNVESALKTFTKNHDNSKALNLDLHLDSSIDTIIDELEGKELDIVIAGPPCQGFSLTGTRNESDERNTLFNAVFRLAEKSNPKAIIIENVTGLLKLYNGKAKEEIVAHCKRLGYNCTVSTLYAPDYGVPQIRKRVFFVAVKEEYGVFEFPKPILQPDNYVTCKEAISDLPPLLDDFGDEQMEYNLKPQSKYQKLMRKKSKELFNHVGTRHTPHVIDVISQVPEGGNHKDLPPGVGDSRKFNEAWTRYHGDKPSKTIDTGHRNHFHYKWNRVPTVRENARLQSFPDKFQFLGTKTQQNRQVGNAVPPILGRVLGEQLLKLLKND